MFVVTTLISGPQSRLWAVLYSSSCVDDVRCIKVPLRQFFLIKHCVSHVASSEKTDAGCESVERFV